MSYGRFHGFAWGILAGAFGALAATTDATLSCVYFVSALAAAGGNYYCRSNDGPQHDSRC